MLIIGYLEWWYGPGWSGNVTRLREHLRRTYAEFSVPTLTRTLFAPWRRIMTPAGGSMSMRFRAAVDNFVSRCVGFTVRLFTLVAGLVIMLTSVVAGLITVAVWPLVPPLGVIMLIVGAFIR